MEKEKLILIDGNSLFFKAYYASFYAKGGHKEDKETYFDSSNNGVRAFINMMNNLKNISSNIVVAFDHKKPKTFRHEYSFYKEGRTKVVPDLYRQFSIAKEFLDIYGIKQITDERYEADDIIGILAKKYQAKYKVDIYTSDKDLLQLVDHSIDVCISKTGVSVIDKFTINNFGDKVFGLKPCQITDLKGIMGDSSDNLKGIHGIGEKGAVKLLLKYGTFEEMIINYEEKETPSLVNKINLGKEIGLISKKIATIITDGDLKSVCDCEFKKTNHNHEELEEFFTKFNLFSLKGKI